MSTLALPIPRGIHTFGRTKGDTTLVYAAEEIRPLLRRSQFALSSTLGELENQRGAGWVSERFPRARATLVDLVHVLDKSGEGRGVK